MTQKSASEGELKRRIGYLEALSQIQSEMSSQQSIDTIINENIIPTALDVLGLGDAACAVLLLAPDGHTFTCKACKGIICSEYDKAPPPRNIKQAKLSRACASNQEDSSGY